MAPKLSFKEMIKKRGYLYFYSGAKEPVERYRCIKPAQIFVLKIIASKHQTLDV